MAEDKNIPRLLSIAQIRKWYISDMSYKKLKAWLLAYIPYKRVGSTYYFSKKRLEEFIESDSDIEVVLDKYS